MDLAAPKKLKSQAATPTEQKSAPPLFRSQVLRVFGLDENKKFSFALKDLATVCAGPFISNSKLEGGDLRQELSLLQQLRPLIPAELNVQIDLMIVDLGCKGEFSDLFAKSKNYVSRLKDTGRVVFFGGYTGSTGGGPGHTVVNEVLCTPGENVGTIRIYNKGDGNENHDHYIQDVKERCTAYFEKKNIPSWILQHPLLFMALLIPRYCQRLQNERWDSRAIYDFVKHILPGDITSATVLVKTAISGTCFRQSILAFLKSNMEEERAYNRLNSARHFVTLIGFVGKESQFQEAQQKVIIRFVLEVLEKLKVSLEIDVKINTFTAEEASVLRNYLLNLEQVYTDKLAYLSQIFWPVQQIAIEPKINSINNGEQILPGKLSDNGVRDGISAQFDPHRIFKVIVKATELLPHLTEVIDAFSRLKKNNLHRDAIYILTLGLAQIPPMSMERKSKKFWEDAILKNDAEKIIKLLSDSIEDVLFVDNELYSPSEFKTMSQLCLAFIAMIASFCGFHLYNEKFLCRFNSPNEVFNRKSHVPSCAIPLAVSFLNAATLYDQIDKEEEKEEIEYVFEVKWDHYRKNSLGVRARNLRPLMIKQLTADKVNLIRVVYPDGIRMAISWKCYIM